MSLHSVLIGLSVKVLIGFFRNLVSPLGSKLGDKSYVDLCGES